jgi:hypothetical protein
MPMPSLVIAELIALATGWLHHVRADESSGDYGRITVKSRMGFGPSMVKNGQPANERKEETS